MPVKSLGESLEASSNRPRIVLCLAGAVVLLLGVSVDVAWFLDARRIIAPIPGFPGMQFNAALGFVLVGAALMAAAISLRPANLVFTATLALLSGATLAQYLTGRDFSLDEFFIKDHINATNPFPGRMAPNSAICFLISALLSSLVDPRAKHPRRLSWIIVPTAMLLTSVLLTIVGQITGLSALYEGWLGSVGMAPNTALGFAVVGAGAGAYVALHGRPAAAAFRASLPALVALAGIVLAVGLWFALITQQYRGIERVTALRAQVLKATVASQIENRIEAMQRIAERMERGAYASQADWEHDAVLYLERVPGVALLAWRNLDGEIRRTAPGNPDPRATRFLDEHGADALAQVPPAAPGPRISPLFTQDDRVGFIATVPVRQGGAVAGSLQGVIDLGATLNVVIRIVAQNEFSVALYQNGEELYANPAPEPGLPGQTAVVVTTQLYGPPWEWRVWPATGLVQSLRTPLPEVTLVAVVLVSGLLALSIRLGQRALRQARELAQANQDLAREVSERRRAQESLAIYAEELRRSNTELGQFAYVASHDLQEPLRMISSYLQLLSKRYGEKLGQDADEFIQYAVDGASRMQLLINDLLAYSRVGRKEKELAPTPMESVLERCLRQLQPTIDENGASVTHGPLPEVLGDDVQLTQLLQNLIGNAIKFHGPDPPAVHVAAQRNGQEWVFSVRDNGIGIDPQYHQRIFQIFQRLHRRDEYPGTGIGLALCQKIVERHGGRIWLESRPGEGATFFFTLRPVPPELGRTRPHG